MRRPRDFDAELKALNDKAARIKERKLHQLGELVIVTGADALDAETLAGMMLAAVDAKDAGAKEAWRAKGVAFFQKRARQPRRGTRAVPTGGAQRQGGEVSA